MTAHRALTLALAALALAGCGGTAAREGTATSHAAAGEPPALVVAVTTTQLQDLVRNVGGDRVQVAGLLKPNVDPHDYEPRPSDAVAIAGAKLIVESGVGIDAWMDKVIDAAASSAPIWVASDGLPLRTGDDAEPEGDPHWWHDPTLFARAATALAGELGRIDPAGAATYRANATRYASEIAAMDAVNARELAQVPVAERRLVTNHDAFGYFATHYGLTVIGSVLGSLSTSAQPSAQSLAALVQRIRDEHVRAIFTETSVNPKLEQQLAREAGVTVSASLYGDTLGPAGSPGATYLGMERANMRAIVDGLLGRPEPAS